MDTLEARLDYRFMKPELLVEALTHPSVPYESHKTVRHNQRMEYLGDAVLQLVLSDVVFQHFPREDEGLLTQLRTRLVQTRTLAVVAKRLNIGEAIIIGKGEEANGGRNRDSTLADGLEAILGAVYLDGGFPAAQIFILKHWAIEIAALKEEPGDLNPKGELQELLQGTGGESPTYRIVAAEGPDHAKMFQAVVVWKGRDLGHGTGLSKKLAQTAAAQCALANKQLRLILTEAAESSSD